MSRRSRDLFDTIRTEGGLLPPDLLKRIAAGGRGLKGLDPADYHLVPGERINEVTSRSWNRLLGAWTAFRDTAAALAPGAPDAGLTRDRWLLVLFQELGYGRLEPVRSLEIDGKAYPISHRWGPCPIHLVGFRTDLDTRTKGVVGAARQSPHSMVKEFLTRSPEALWGCVSNGHRLRLLRDNASLTRQAYVEFDLEAMMLGEVYADFVILWLLCHQSRVEPRGEGNVFRRDAGEYLPLYEAKMVHQFDHRYGDYAIVLPGQGTHILPAVQSDRLEDPAYMTAPRYWVPADEVEARISNRWRRGWLLGWRDVTDARASARTVIASVLPRVGVGHTVPLMFPSGANVPTTAALLGNLTSYAFDYVARQKVGGTHLTYGYLNQLPVLEPQTYAERAPWKGRDTLEAELAPQVLELAYTAWDLELFARDCGYDGPPFRWDEERRFLLRCELDAAFFHLYGIAREDVDYIMDTFPIVRRKDEARFNGDYRTKRVILDVYDRMQRAIDTGEPYQTLLDPPPADPRVAHPPRI